MFGSFKRCAGLLVVAALAVGTLGALGGTASGTPAAAAKKGGDGTILQGIDAQSLDPTLVINSASQGSTVMNALYDVLLLVKADGTVQPNIAESFTSQDGITWTMKLRPGLKFTDGTPFDAAAVKAHWERCQPNLRCGGGAYIQKATMNAVDATTFTITLAKENRQFAYVVPQTNLGWIPSPTAVAAAGADYTNKPVGAGPFILDSRTPNSETVLKRNPDYWQKGLPKLDTLTIKTIVDGQQLVDTFTTGGGDAAVNINEAYLQQVKEGGYPLLKVNNIAGTTWLFGSKRAPFDDIEKRRAVYLAIDRDEFNQVAFNGTATVPTNLFPKGTPYYNAKNNFPKNNAKEAQALFDKFAAAGTPLEFTITTVEGDQRAVALQTMLSKYKNVKVSVEFLPGSSYGTTLFAGNFDIAIFGVTGPDPEPAVQTFTTTYLIPIASMNSQVVDDAVTAGEVATDTAGRKKAYDVLAKAVNDEYKFLWFSRGFVWTAQAKDYTGLVLFGAGSALPTTFGKK